MADKKNNNILLIVLIILGVLLAGYLLAKSGILTGWASRANQPQCMNGIDDDSDGKIDYPNDPGCLSKKDTTETNPNVQCDDGVDNDGDGRADINDPGCASSTDTSELNPSIECDDAKDNDNDTKIDLSDTGCSSLIDNDETNCGDGICEGGETQFTCSADCGLPPTNNTNSTNSTIMNTCFDTDGGFNKNLKGTVSGSFNNANYTHTDFCITSTDLAEYYCSVNKAYSINITCAANSTTMCSDGACI